MTKDEIEKYRNFLSDVGIYRGDFKPLYDRALFDSVLQKAINFDNLPAGDMRIYIIKDEMIDMIGRSCFYQHQIMHETEKAYLLKPQQWIPKSAIKEITFKMQGDDEDFLNEIIDKICIIQEKIKSDIPVYNSDGNNEPLFEEQANKINYLIDELRLSICEYLEK